MIAALPLLLAAQLIQPGDRVGILGDSLTWKGQYGAALELVHTLRHPSGPATWISRGYSGYASLSGEPHVTDLLLEHPDVVLVEFGANDVGLAWSQTTQDNWTRGLGYIVADLRAAGVTRIAVFSPPAVEPKKYGANATVHNANIVRVAAAGATWAAAQGVTYVDLGQPLLDIFSATASQAWSWTSDGTHPGVEGGLAMATLILQALGETGGISDALVVVGGSHSGTATISNIAGAGVSALDFDRLDPATPTIIPATSKISSDGLILGSSRQAVRYIPGWAPLNSWTLTVTGLSAGTWRLLEDGVPFGAYSATELAAGVDLARAPVDTTSWTVASNQTADVLGRRSLRTLPNGIWERVQAQAWVTGSFAEWTAPVGSASTCFLFFSTAEWNATSAARNALVAAVDSTLDGWATAYHARAQPRTHHFSLRKP